MIKLPSIKFLPTDRHTENAWVRLLDCIFASIKECFHIRSIIISLNVCQMNGQNEASLCVICIIIEMKVFTRLLAYICSIVSMFASFEGSWAWLFFPKEF